MHAGGSVWPAKVCYKILCDKICADNFDNLIDKCTGEAYVYFITTLLLNFIIIRAATCQENKKFIWLDVVTAQKQVPEKIKNFKAGRY